MERISIHNYEAYLLDLVEGRLTIEQQMELDTFMALHPDLSVDLEGLAEVSFDPQEAVFLNKDALKKTESDLVSAERLIAYVEQQLSSEDKRRVEESCAANPALAKELELYKHTIATADTSIVFEEKDSLKRRSKVILFNFRAASFAAAASVALLIMLYVLWPSKTADVLTNSYAQNDIRKATGRTSDTNAANSAEPGVHGHHTPQGHVPEHTPLQNQFPAPEHQIAQKQETNSKQETSPVNSMAPDSSSHLVKGKESIREQKLIAPQEPVLVASANRKTTVDVITENDGEDTESQKKSGFWAMAGKTLKGLNKAGVKTVNGEEENNKNNATYALTLGGMSITHKAH